MSITVDLTPHELTTAAMVGVRRRIHMIARAEHDGEANPFTLDESPFEGAIIGAMAEFVVARAFNLFWADNVGKRNAVDVGGLVEVRARRLGGCGLDLGIRAHDKLDLPFVLVHADIPHFTMVGWIYGRDAWAIGAPTSRDWLRFVPAKLPPLREMTDLLDELSLWQRGEPQPASARAAA